MRKYALFGMIAVLSFGSVGCMNVGNRWNLPDPDQATVVDVWSDYENHEGKSVEVYIVVFELRERFAKVRVAKDTFEAVHEGDKAEVELMSLSLTQDDQYLLETEYCWHVGGRDYQVIFKSSAKERPARPKADPSRT